MFWSKCFSYVSTAQSTIVCDKWVFAISIDRFKLYNSENVLNSIFASYRSKNGWKLSKTPFAGLRKNKQKN